MELSHFYAHPETRISELSFKRASLEPLIDPDGGAWGMPVGNTITFKAPRGFFWFARQRLSPDESDIEIASLFGCVKLSAQGLDVLKPIGVAAMERGSALGAAFIPAREWGLLFPKARGALQARKLENGLLEPISTSMALRSMEGVSYERYVVLPKEPSSIERVGKIVRIESDGLFFSLTDPAQMKAALDGSAIWITPKEDGAFGF